MVDLCCGGFGGCFELPEWVWLISVAVVWWLICVAGMGVVGTVEKKKNGKI